MTPSEFAARIAEAAAGRPRLVVGIAGAPGAGKSTLAAAIAEALAPDAVVLPMDGFHLPQAQLVALGRRERMGAPDTFDVDAFVATLEALRRSSPEEPPVRAPLFDRTIEEPVADALEVTPDIRIVLVEGNYLLHDRDGWERVRPLLDLTAYVDEDDELRIERLIARHVAFGKSPDAARAWVLDSDEANARLIAATAHRADATVNVD
jgi:pantothenate kinase